MHGANMKITGNCYFEISSMHLFETISFAANPNECCCVSFFIVHRMKVPVRQIQSYFTMCRGIYAPHMPYVVAVSTCVLCVLLLTAMDLVAAKLFMYL